MAGYLLYERPGWGSAIVEAQLAWYGLPYRLEAVGDLFESAEARERLRAVNPIAQVPTLVLPDGAVMSESAAITLHLADAAGSADLVPGAPEAERPPFLRWLVFIVANIYPTFTYADVPSRFVPEVSAAAFRGNLDAYQQELWRAVEAGARPVVPRRALLGARHLSCGHDALAAEAAVVRGQRAEAARRRARGRGRAAARGGVRAEFPGRGRRVGQAPPAARDPASSNGGRGSVGRARAATRRRRSRLTQQIRLSVKHGARESGVEQVCHGSVAELDRAVDQGALATMGVAHIDEGVLDVRERLLPPRRQRIVGRQRREQRRDVIEHLALRRAVAGDRGNGGGANTIGMPLVTPPATTVSLPRPPDTKNKPALEPATSPLASVTLLPAAERRSCSTLVTPANCAALTVPPPVSRSVSKKLAETMPVMVSDADSVAGVKLKMLVCVPSGRAFAPVAGAGHLRLLEDRRVTRRAAQFRVG